MALQPTRYGVPAAPVVTPSRAAELFVENITSNSTSTKVKILTATFTISSF
jgi:hypothetical protein